MRRREVDGRAVVDTHWPYDGPHTPDRVIQAAAAVEQLLRYLANATAGDRAGLRGSDVAAVLSALAGALHIVPTLTGRIAGIADRIAGDPTIYDDRRDRPGRDTALQLAVVLAEVRDAARALAGRSDQASGIASHLGHDEPGAGR